MVRLADLPPLNPCARFEHRRHTSVAMNRNYSETSMISIPADKNNKAIILDVGGKKHKIRGGCNGCDVSRFKVFSSGTEVAKCGRGRFGGSPGMLRY